jgi:1,4-alpha-glucan branching enzyme
MHDTLELLQTAPEYRSRDYHKLTFSMMYYYDESYLLPLSHDEVVHGKATIIQKMNGEYDRKFPQAKLLYMYMYAHPGKKLNFMGNELGQFREWDEKREQDWGLLSYPIHDAFHQYIKTLNQIYLSNPALSARDYGRDGFWWVECHREAQCIYAFMRTDGVQQILTVLNLSDREQEYGLTLPKKGSARLLLSTEEEAFGGTEPKEEAEIREKLSVILPPFSGKMYLLFGMDFS